MTRPTTPVAFLGLGRMGLPMSRNLAARGYSVRAWNRTAKQLPDQPGTDYHLATSPAEAVRGCEVVLTMLPDIQEVRSVCAGPDGALAGAVPGALIVVMGTVSPVAIRDFGADLANQGFRVADAPVSGGDVGAHDASLSIMFGGDHVDFETTHDVLSAMGNVVRYLGPLGSGQLAKACNQIVVATTLAALGEAAALAANGGLDVDEVFEILSGGLANSRALEIKRQKIVDHSFAPGGSAAFQHKDLGFALEAARSAGCALPVTAIVDQLFGAMRWTGHGDDDHSGVVQIIEALSRAAT